MTDAPAKKKQRQRYRTILPAPKFCGRGIEYVLLTRQEKLSAKKRAAQIVGGRATAKGVKVDQESFEEMLEYRDEVVHQCVLEMLKGVTREDGLTSVEQIKPDAKPAIEWVPLSIETLEGMDDPNFSYDALFGSSALDDEAVNALYIDTHGFDASVVKALAGKAVAVPVG